MEEETVRPVPTDTDRKPGAMQRFAFPAFVLVAGVVTWFALTAAGMAAGPFGKLSYPGTIGTIVGIFNLVIMVWPLFLTIKNRQERYSYMLIRIIAIVVSIPVCFLLLPLLIRLMAMIGWAEGLFKLAGLPGIAALALHGWFAVQLAHYKSDDGQLKGLETDYDEANQDLATLRRREREAQGVYSDREAEQAAHAEGMGALIDAQTEASDRLELARSDYDTHPKVIKLSDTEAERDRLKVEYEDLPTRITGLEEKEAKESKAKNEKVLEYIRSELAAARARRMKLNDELLHEEHENSVHVRLTALRAEVDRLKVKEDFDSAQVTHKEASEAVAAARVEQTKLEARVDTAGRDMAEAQRLVEKKEAERATIDESIKEARKSDVSVQRDVIAPLLLTFLPALICYSSWEGWIMSLVR